MLSYVLCYVIIFWLVTSWLRLPPTKSTTQVLNEVDDILSQHLDLLSVRELKALVKSHGHHGYSKLHKSELISLLS